MVMTRDRTAVEDAIRVLAGGRNLEEKQAYAVACSIMEDAASPAQIGALLVALRMKGETVAEITGFARAMREKADRVPVDADSVVDTCGTGGDGMGTFNVSTACAFVAAGAGVRVAKHGNRSVSGRCGSADVLEALGVNGHPGPEEAAGCIDRLGLAFLFAPLYHKATRHAVAPRREIGVRSIFNIVGPLTNPAGARRQLVGVYDASLTEPAANVLRRLGSIHCMVVHGSDGLDEITLGGTTQVSELRNGRVRTYQLEPRDLGFRRRSSDEVRGGDAAANARIIRRVLEGEEGARREIVLLNASAVIYVAGCVDSLAAGVEAATRSIDSGQALARLCDLINGAHDG